MTTSVATEIEGVLIIEPTVWQDARGYFFESFQKEKYSDLGISCDFIQDNESYSERGVLRGLHFQRPPYEQAKLVREVQGEVLDVIVDLRPGSKTYGKSLSFVLNDTNKRQLFVPRGFAHGYLVLSNNALFIYKCDQYYTKSSEGGIRYDDPTLAIDWQLEADGLKISEKDLCLPYFKDHLATLV